MVIHRKLKDIYDYIIIKGNKFTDKDCCDESDYYESNGLVDNIFSAYPSGNFNLVGYAINKIDIYNYIEEYKITPLK